MVGGRVIGSRPDRPGRFRPSWVASHSLVGLHAWDRGKVIMLAILHRVRAVGLPLEVPLEEGSVRIAPQLTT